MKLNHTIPRKIFYITDDIKSRAGLPCASKVDSHTGDLSSSAQVHGSCVELQPGALAIGSIPGLPVARYTARSQRPGLPISTFKLPAQLQGEGGKARCLALHGQSLAGNSEGQRGRVDGEGRRFWVEKGEDS